MKPQPITLPNQLAAALRSQRTLRGMTQAEAGANVGLLPKTISALESTPERSSIGSLLKLLAALDLQLVLEPRGPRRDTGVEW
jgi:HTH-type transcriptional regulator / antitoxin HipB